MYMLSFVVQTYFLSGSNCIYYSIATEKPVVVPYEKQVTRAAFAAGLFDIERSFGDILYFK